MRLELHINGSYFSSVAIDELQMVPFLFQLQYRVTRNAETLQLLVTLMKADFFRQLAKAGSYEIFFIAESNFNKQL